MNSARYILVFAIAAGLSAQTQQNQQNQLPADPDAGVAQELKRFTDVLSVLETQGAGDHNPDKLIYEGAIPSMLRQLDPHTQFFQPSQFEQLKQMEQAEQKGFGSVVSVLPGQVIFLQILPGTPTSKAGIQPGDELVAINNIAIHTLEPEQIIQLLTEARQQSIQVYIRRQGDAKLLQFTLTPELMQAPSVDRAFLLSPKTGYIRITSWDMETVKQFSDALSKLHPEELTGLVIDLRDNPGGIVRSSLDVASMFLAPGERILTAKGRSGVTETADVPKTAKPYGFKLAVLVNGKTASASEIFSGALQDHDRAVIVGEPTYGKGLVQSVVPLSENAGLAITTAFYYTPSGRSIQKPLKNSALSDTFHQEQSAPKYKTDAGRSVTGGGGIQPDVVIGPAQRTRLEVVLDASGAITAFATDYLSSHPKAHDGFTITPEILDDFKVFLSSRNIQPSVTEWLQERSWITTRLLEEIIVQSESVAKGDEIAATHDTQIQAAVSALSNPKLLASR